MNNTSKGTVLFRWVGLEKDGSYYVLETPIDHIHVGEFVHIREGSDPVEVTNVFHTLDGKVFAEVDRATYTRREISDSDWESQLKYHTDGWSKMSGEWSPDYVHASAIAKGTS